MVQTGGVAGKQLRNYFERIERLEEEKRGIAEDIKEVYAGAKACGFDAKVMRKVISLRRMDPADRQEMEALVDVYMHATEGRPLPEIKEVSSVAPSQQSRDTVNPAFIATPTDADKSLYEHAVEVVTRDRRASTSYVQRRLKIGYNKAAGFIEKMEAEGIISAPNEKGAREVLAKPKTTAEEAGNQTEKD